MIFISNKIHPNSNEAKYWADLTENPYGGVVKYYDSAKDQWVYIEEPIFQNSPANNITKEDIDNIYKLDMYIDIINSLVRQMDAKADVDSVYTKEESDNIITQIYDNIDQLRNTHSEDIAELDRKISNLDVTGSNNISTIQNDIRQIQDTLDGLNDTYVHKEEGKSLVDDEQIAKLLTLHNYDDTDIINALNLKASKTYVESRLSQVSELLVGAAPEVLDTLEELANALNNDANFAATVATQLSLKADKDSVYTKEEIDLWTKNFISDVNTINTIVQQAIPKNISYFSNDMNYVITETDPTVPSWAKQSTKPTYTASEVGALPANTVIPSKTSQLTNDSYFTTESDVVNIIKENQCITDAELDKVRFLYSTIKYDITESSNLETLDNYPVVRIDQNYSTHVLNIYSTIENLIIQFINNPILGYKYTLYITPSSTMNILFPILGTNSYQTINISNIKRLDITAIDVNTTTLETNEGQLSTNLGQTISVNSLTGYLLEYYEE